MDQPESATSPCNVRQVAPSDAAAPPDSSEWGVVAFDALAEAVYTVDTAGRITWANAAFERLTGYRLAEVQGQPSTRYYVPEAETLFVARRHLVSQGELVTPTLDTVLICHDGTQVPVKLAVSSFGCADRPMGRLAVLHPHPTAAGTPGKVSQEAGRTMALDPSTVDAEAPVPPSARQCRWRRAWRGLPLLVGTVGLVATMLVWQALRHQKYRHVQQTVAAAATVMQHEIVTRLQTRVQALVHLARTWEQWGQPPQEEWAFLAALQIEHFPGYQVIAWIDPAWRLRWLVPLAGNEAALGLDATTEPRRRIALETARDQRTVTATRPFPLVQGGTGFAVYVPLFPSTGFAGVISAAFRPQPFFDTILADVAPGYSLALSVDEETLYQSASALRPQQTPWQQERHLSIQGVPWRLRMWPQEAVLLHERTALPTVVLGGGISLSVLLALVTALLQRTRQSNRVLDWRVQERTDALAAANKALRESALRLQLALDSASIGIYEWYPVTGMRLWDDRLRAHWGLAPGTPASYDVFMAGIHPADRAIVQATVDRALEPQGLGHYATEYRVIGLQDGIERWIAATGQVFFAHGRAVRLVGTTLDITARKQAEAALRDLNATLEQRVAERTTALEQAMAEQQRLEWEARRAEHFVLLGRLAAGVSHELRNPLAAIFLHVDLLEEEMRDPSPDATAAIAEALVEIKTNLARVEDLMQDYLSLVRAAAIQREVQDLGAVVTAWSTEMQQEVAGRGVSIETHGLAQLGPVAFHANTLRRALLNLVHNAADAMPQGGTITLLGQATATHVQLQVQDTGSGIPADKLARIFEPLYTTKPAGTGLGLYIVREIVEAHEGQITVASVAGQGATFTLTLPRLASPATLEASTEPGRG